LFVRLTTCAPRHPWLINDCRSARARTAGRPDTRELEPLRQAGGGVATLRLAVFRGLGARLRAHRAGRRPRRAAALRGAPLAGARRDVGAPPAVLDLAAGGISTFGPVGGVSDRARHRAVAVVHRRD